MPSRLMKDIHVGCTCAKTSSAHAGRMRALSAPVPLLAQPILLVFPISFPANIPERVSVNCGPTAIVHHPEKEPKIRRTIGNKSKPDQMHQNRSKMSGPRPDKSFLELQHCEILLLLGHEKIRFDDLRRPCQKPLHAWSTLVCNPHREIYIYI